MVNPNGDGSFIRTAKATQLNAIKEDLEAESQLLKVRSCNLKHWLPLARKPFLVKDPMENF